MDRGVACRLAAALSFAVNESGAISTKTVVLQTPEEVDVAANKKVNFRAPGHWSGKPTRFRPLTFASRSRCSSRLGPRMACRRSRTSRATLASEEMVVLRRQASAGWSHQIADGGAVGSLVRPNEASCKARDISRQASETRLSIEAIWHPHTPAACWYDRPTATVRISASRRSSLRRPKIWRNSSGS